MDDLARKLGDAGARLDPEWDEDRVEEVLDGTRRRIRRRRLARPVAATAAVAAAVVAAVSWVGLRGGEGPANPSGEVAEGSAGAGPARRGDGASSDNSGSIRLGDGSTATPVGEGSEIVAARVSDAAVTMRLDRGAARFEVARDPERQFRVEAGAVTVVVIGTSFSVARGQEQVEVEVHRGRVRVEWEGGHQDVWAGGRGLYPPPAEPEVPEAPPTSPTVPAEDPQPPPSMAEPGSEWRVLAEAGRFDEAWGALSDASVSADVAELLLAADVARHAGHPAAAAGYLRRAVDGDPSDPRAPLAAFTLGRVLLGQAGRPAEAAEAFARARDLAPGGSLAEDALAREVEAWARAGRGARARDRAEAYLARYPEGRRLEAVRRHGGLAR